MSLELVLKIFADSLYFTGPILLCTIGTGRHLLTAYDAPEL